MSACYYTWSTESRGIPTSLYRMFGIKKSFVILLILEEWVFFCFKSAGVIFKHSHYKDSALSRVKSNFKISIIFLHLGYFLLWSTGCKDDSVSTAYW